MLRGRSSGGVGGRGGTIGRGLLGIFINRPQGNRINLGGRKRDARLTTGGGRGRKRMVARKKHRGYWIV